MCFKSHGLFLVSPLLSVTMNKPCSLSSIALCAVALTACAGNGTDSPPPIPPGPAYGNFNFGGSTNFNGNSTDFEALNGTVIQTSEQIDLQWTDSNRIMFFAYVNRPLISSQILPGSGVSPIALSYYEGGTTISSSTASWLSNNATVTVELQDGANPGDPSQAQFVIQSDFLPSTGTAAGSIPLLATVRVPRLAVLPIPAGVPGVAYNYTQSNPPSLIGNFTNPSYQFTTGHEYTVELNGKQIKLFFIARNLDTGYDFGNGGNFTATLIDGMNQTVATSGIVSVSLSGPDQYTLSIWDLEFPGSSIPGKIAGVYKVTILDN